MMKKILLFPILILFIILLYGQSQAGEEVYLADAKITPGKIFQILSAMPGHPGPFLWPKYFRPSGNIHAIAFHKYGPAYFVDANRYDIYKTDGVTEEKIFTHTTYIRDIAFDSRGRMYFSEASGAGADGVIYHLNQHTGQKTRFVSVPRNSVDGFWSGHFAFNQQDQLFISSGNRTPASIFAYAGGHFQKLYTHHEPITGFAFVDNRTLLFTNHRQQLYELRIFRDRTPYHEAESAQWLNDVAVVQVPESGACEISGRLLGGNELWPLTHIEAFGPNVVWRRPPGHSVRVDGGGRYTIRNLPVGRYRVRTDIRGDTPVGFDPESRTINCPGAVANINFTFAP